LRRLGLRELCVAVLGVLAFACAAGLPDSYLWGRTAVLVLACLCGAAAIAARRESPSGPMPVLGAVVAAAAVATLIWSADRWSTALWVGHLASYAGVAAAAALLVDDDERAGILVLAFTAGLVYSAARGAEQVAWSLRATEQVAREAGLFQEGSALAARIASRRAFGDFTSPATYGGVALFCLPFAVVCARGAREPLLRLLGWAGLALGLCAVALSGSKAALAAGLAVGLLVLAASWGRLARPVRWVCLALVIVAVAGGFVVGRRLGTGALAESARVRLGYWQGALSVWERAPAGVGLGNFGLVYPQVKDERAEETQLVHNDYLQALAETGPLVPAGLLALAVSVCAVALASLRDGPRHSFLRAARMAGAVACALALARATVDYVLYEPSQGILLGMAGGLAAGLPGRRRDLTRAWRAVLVAVLVIAGALGVVTLASQARKTRAEALVSAAGRVLEGDVESATALLAGETVRMLVPGAARGVSLPQTYASAAAGALGVGSPELLQGGEAVWTAADALLRAAEGSLRGALKLTPGEPEAEASLGEVLAMRAGIEEDRNLYEEALGLLEDAVEHDGAGRAWLRARMADLLLAKRDREGAARWLAEAAELYPTKPEYRFRLAHLYATMGLSVEARREAAEGLRLREMLYDRGRYRALEGEAAWACSYLEEGT